LRVQTRLEFAKMHRQFRATVVYVTHDQIEAMTLGDKIVVLHEGRIQQAGSPLELYQQPQNLFVATFIGSPKMNLLPGTLSAIKADHVQVQLNGKTEIRADVQAKGHRVGEPVTVGVRSEHLTEGDALTERFSGEAAIVDHHGDANYIYLTLASGQEMVVRGDGNRDIRIGEKMTVSTSSSAFYVFDDKGLALPRLRPGSMVTARKR
jgi:ABC-type sugar transport system ATPase subunit